MDDSQVKEQRGNLPSSGRELENGEEIFLLDETDDVIDNGDQSTEKNCDNSTTSDSNEMHSSIQSEQRTPDTYEHEIIITEHSNGSPISSGEDDYARNSPSLSVEKPTIINHNHVSFVTEDVYTKFQCRKECNKLTPDELFAKKKSFATRFANVYHNDGSNINKNLSQHKSRSQRPQQISNNAYQTNETGRTIYLDPNESNNEETYFALSLIGALKRLNPRKRAIAKCNILKYLTNLEYADASLM